MIAMPHWPPPVFPGDLVGVAALSGPVDLERLDEGLAALRALGFEPVEASNLRTRVGLFAGDDDARLAGFHDLVADPTIKAIFFARGGAGLLRLMPRLDWALIGSLPRAYVGYSDLTPLLLQIIKRCGWISLHGPMVAADLARGLTAEESASLLSALAGRPVDVPLTGAVPPEPIAGPLLGGCLSLIAAMVATPFAIDLDSSLLFLEDVEEPPFRLDRLLTHLGLSGTLAGVRAMIVGHLSLFPKGVELSAWNGEVTGRSVFRERAAAFGKPIALGCPAGHDRPNWTLPLGAWARLLPEGRLCFGPFEE